MATIKIDDKTIEITVPVSTKYTRKELVRNKRELKFQLDQLNLTKTLINKQIDDINLLIAECDNVGVVDES